MSEASFDLVLQELRDTAPGAPERLRDRVRAMAVVPPRRALRLRPALAAAIAIALAVGLGAGIIGGVTGSSEQQAEREGVRFAPALERLSSDQGGQELRLVPGLTAKSRLQQQQVSMQLRVDDLSGATQKAVRETRQLGGYVAAANYSTGETMGDSRLDLRVPAQNVQKAITSFTELGTILAQRISVADLQAGLDRLEARIAAKEKLLETLTGDRLLRQQRALRRLERSRVALVREGTYAKISLQLTTAKPAAKQQEPGRFDRFWGDAGNILGKEVIAVLYALVIVGPFAILVLFALFAERTKRRRADHRLLEETG
jgi:Domain of unknown function (DUF4349)